MYYVNYFLLNVADTYNRLDIEQDTCAKIPGKSYVTDYKCHITLIFCEYKVVSVWNSLINFFCEMS